MNVRGFTITRKTIGDFASPLLLVSFFVPFGVLTYLIATIAVQPLPDGVASLPLEAQEQWLTAALSQVSFTWGAGIPAMVLVTVLAANGIASEFERGTLRILLSKPIHRWELVVGKFLAIFLFTVLVMIAGILVSTSVVFYQSGASPGAIAGSVGSLLPGNLLYALFVSLVVAAAGTFAAVMTGNRLQTVLGIFLIPVLFFGFMVFRFAPTGDVYEEYWLYLIDLNYHFGNAFVFLHELAGTEFNPETQSSLATTTGVYDTAESGVDPLVGGISGSVPLTGHVPPAASVVLLLVLGIGLLAGAIFYFERTDVA